MLIAEGEKQSTLLRADAAKQAKIMAAEAEAESILKVQQAMADSMRMLNENAPNDQVIKLKALEALEKVADGKATKLIIPSEIQGLAGLAASAKMLVENDAPAAEESYGKERAALYQGHGGQRLHQQQRSTGGYPNRCAVSLPRRGQFRRADAAGGR